MEKIIEKEKRSVRNQNKTVLNEEKTHFIVVTCCSCPDGASARATTSQISPRPDALATASIGTRRSTACDSCHWPSNIPLL